MERLKVHGPMPPIPELIGQRFGQLTIVGEADPIRVGGKRRRMVIARCDCESETVAPLHALKSGNTKSCGCQKLRAMAVHNAKRCAPQEWIVQGDEAHIFIGETKVLIDAADVPLVSHLRWGVSNGYITAKNRTIHRMIMGLAVGDPREVDHRKHNKADNRRSQLRFATRSQNAMNMKAVGSTSAYKGVHFAKRNRLWIAKVKKGRRSVAAKYCHTEREAALAYNEMAKEHFGEFAVLNDV
jgi:hypothetical protein